MKILVVDIGGTSIKYACMREDMTMLTRGKIPTPKEGREELIEAIGKLYDGLPDVEGIAISMPGIIDSAGGYCVMGGALRYNDDFYLRHSLYKRCPVTVSYTHLQQRLGKVQKAHPRAAIPPFSGDSGLHTADGAVVVSVLRLHALLDKAGNDHLVVVERRHAEAAAHHLHAFLHEPVGQPAVIPYRQIGLGQMAFGHTL